MADAEAGPVNLAARETRPAEDVAAGPALTAEDIAALVADLLSHHGNRFIADDELADLQHAIQPFLTAG